MEASSSGVHSLSSQLSTEVKRGGRRERKTAELGSVWGTEDLCCVLCCASLHSTRAHNPFSLLSSLSSLGPSLDRPLLVRFFCNRELEPKRQSVTTKSECTLLKHTHAGAEDSRSHLPVLLPTCPLSRANYLRVITMGMGQSRSWLAQAVASLRTVVQSQGDVTNSTRVLRPAGRIGYGFISLIPPSDDAPPCSRPASELGSHLATVAQVRASRL